jgi:hypothetical protein
MQGKTVSEDDCRLMMLGTLTVFLWSVIAIMHWFGPPGSEQTSVPRPRSSQCSSNTMMSARFINSAPAGDTACAPNRRGAL